MTRKRVKLEMCVSRRRQFGAILVVSLCFPILISAKTRRVSVPVPDANYTAALAVADKFLQAWQSENQEDGLMLLSDAAKAHASEESLQAFFEHGTASYEIARGRTMKDGRYAFPVVLFQGAPGTETSAHPHLARIVVARTGKSDWVIDRLP
jgi:hypothetical protein